MAATRETVLAAIVEYVENNKRRAPAADIAVAVGDTLPNVQGIIKSLVTEGTINSSRGRNGGVLPDGVVLEKKVKPAKAKPASDTTEESSEASTPEEDDTSAQFAALLEKLEAESNASIEAAAEAVQ